MNLNQMNIPSRSKECPFYFPVILCGLAALLASGLAAAVQQASVPTIQFTAESFTIQEGQSTTLRWKVDNAKTVSIQPVVGAVDATGSLEVRPSSSVTYTIHATGPGGAAIVTIRVIVTTQK